MKTSSLIRREALQMNNELLVYPYLMDASKIELIAMNKLKEAFLLIYKDAVINEKNNSSISKTMNIKSSDDLYFKIQVAASKKVLSKEQIGRVSVNNETISSEYDNGWYKYSLREKFKTYEKAFEYKQLIDVKGSFILAFLDGEKVHVSQAVEWQNNKSGKRLGKNKNRTVYRLRIGISTMPASDKRMKEMNSGGRPIIIVSHDGWFTYTIGDFNSKREAISFKNNKTLTDAMVVAFKNGKPIENN